MSLSPVQAANPSQQYRAVLAAGAAGGIGGLCLYYFPIPTAVAVAGCLSAHELHQYCNKQLASNAEKRIATAASTARVSSLPSSLSGFEPSTPLRESAFVASASAASDSNEKESVCPPPTFSQAGSFSFGIGPQKNGFISSTPTDLISNIFGYLPAKEIFGLSRASRRWNQITQTCDRIWVQALSNEFSQYPALPKKSNPARAHCLTQTERSLVKFYASNPVHVTTQNFDVWTKRPFHERIPDNTLIALMSLSERKIIVIRNDIPDVSSAEYNLSDLIAGHPAFPDHAFVLFPFADVIWEGDPIHKTVRIYSKYCPFEIDRKENLYLSPETHFISITGRDLIDSRDHERLFNFIEGTQQGTITPFSIEVLPEANCEDEAWQVQNREWQACLNGYLTALKNRAPWPAAVDIDAPAAAEPSAASDVKQQDKCVVM